MNERRHGEHFHQHREIGMSYQTNLNVLTDLRQRLGVRCLEGGRPYYPVPYASRVTGIIEDETHGCEGPHYELEHNWATSAIFDRLYKPDTGPAVNWHFNLIDRPGLVLTVTPLYEPKEDHIRSLSTPWRAGDEPLYTRAEAEEAHREIYGSSNWAATCHSLLRVLDPATHRTVRGYLEGHDYAYTHMVDPDLAQPVLDTLWAATHHDPRAFAGATHCAFCAHPLSDALSAARGYGPDCAKRFKLPWLRVVPAPSATTTATEPRP
jgi:hypothetical protein